MDWLQANEAREISKGGVVMLSPHPDHVREAAPKIVAKWAQDHHSPTKPSGESFVVTAIEEFDGLISGLGTRTGAREDDLRRWATGQRGGLLESLEAYRRIGADLSGLAEPLDRFTAIRSSACDAVRAYDTCIQPDRVIELGQTRDRAMASLRGISVECNNLLFAAKLPNLLQLEQTVKSIRAAKTQCKDVLHLANRRRPAAAAHLALDQARDEQDPVVIRCWVAFETAKGPGAEAFRLRWTRYEELHEGDSNVAVAAE